MRGPELPESHVSAKPAYIAGNEGGVTFYARKCGADRSLLMKARDALKSTVSVPVELLIYNIRNPLPNFGRARITDLRTQYNSDLWTSMKARIFFAVVILAFLQIVQMHAATNFVILGDDFQTKIDAASPGDTLVVQAGVYSGNLNFNKALTVLRSGTNLIQFLGTVQITGAGNSSFQFSEFFSPVTVQATGTVSFAQSQFLSTLFSQEANILMSQVTSSNYIQANLAQGSGTNFQAYDSSLWQLEFIGGKTVLKRCSINKVGYTTLTLSSNATFDGLRVTNNGVCVAEATTGSGTPFVLVQSSFLYEMNLTGYKVWLGYNTFGRPLALTGCDSVLIGNEINYVPALSCQGGGTVSAYNNRFWWNSAITAGGLGGEGNLVSLDGVNVEFANNTFLARRTGGLNGMTLRGLFLTNGSVAAIRANVFHTEFVSGGPTTCWCVESIGSVASISYSDLFGPSAPSVQGIDQANLAHCIFSNPLFSNLGLPLDVSLAVGSPAINTGPPDAIFNDRDGTRNDMGYTGGPFWNPANYTNDDPMVFFLTASRQTVLKGVQTNITVNAAASAGH